MSMLKMLESKKKFTILLEIAEFMLTGIMQET